MYSGLVAIDFLVGAQRAPTAWSIEMWVRDTEPANVSNEEAETSGFVRNPRRLRRGRWGQAEQERLAKRLPS